MGEEGKKINRIIEIEILIFFLKFSYFRNRQNFRIKIECINKKNENCIGKFVMNIDNICYFLYETKKSYQIQEINDLCLKNNQTEIDYSTNIPYETFSYLQMVFEEKGIILNDMDISINYFSNKIFKK